MPDTPIRPRIGMPFIELQTVDSTNYYAFCQIHAGLAQHGMAVFAHEQTAGKGQRGKKWVSSRGVNIALSLIIKPAPLQVSQQFQLSVCASLAVHDFFSKYARNDAKIKWPNDLYWKDRKAGGILIESIVRSSPGEMNQGQETDNWQWAVIGIGININQTLFPPDLPNPVSLKQITGKHFDTIELAKELCGSFNDHFENLIAGSFEKMHAEYLSHLYKLNKKVKLRKDNRVFEALVKTVSPSGRLVVQHTIEEEFDFGSVEWII